MSYPSTVTIKKLSMLSGNTCAFPKCPMSLVDEGSGTITAQMCHIKAKNPGGARYDAAQTNEERDAFENLILMCPMHHKIIDDDEESYTVERLYQIKKTHESRVSAPDEQGNLEKLLESYLRSVIENQNYQPRITEIPRVGLDIKHITSRVYDGFEEYIFMLDMTNAGSHTISNYRLDIEFPRIFLNASTVYFIEKADKGNDKYRFFRVTQENHNNVPLHPDDERRVFQTNYSVNYEKISYGKAFDENVRIKVYIDDNLERTVEKPMRELINNYK